MHSISPKFATAKLFLVAALSGFSLAAMAEGMVPETPIVIVDEAKGEGSINVKNTDSMPALLHTTLEHIPEDTEDLLVLTPPLARVEAGDTQLVRFILQNEKPLTTERLKRVSFEGIKPREQHSGAHVAMSVRQNLPVIVRPANLPVERAPWTLLTWSLQGSQLVVKNPSPYVVRLSNMVNLAPANLSLDLGRTYLLPGEQKSLPLPSMPQTQPTGVRLFPATTYGFAVGHYDAPLAPN